MGQFHALSVSDDVAYWQAGLDNALRMAKGESAASHFPGGALVREAKASAPGLARTAGGVAVATGIAAGTVAGLGYGAKRLFEAAEIGEP